MKAGQLVMAGLLSMAMAGPAAGMYCTPLGTAGLVIGRYQPMQMTAQDAQTSFAIECFPSVPGENLSLSVRLVNAGTGRLRLSQAGSEQTLAVHLYRDAARSVPLDDQSAIRYSDRPTIPTLYWVSLYARVPGGQDAATGLYQLPLTVLIEY